MKRLTSKQIDARDAQDCLEDAVNTSAALLEAVAELMMKGAESPDGLTLFKDTIRGLHLLAIEQGTNLRTRFYEMVEALHGPEHTRYIGAVTHNSSHLAKGGAGK